MSHIYITLVPVPSLFQFQVPISMLDACLVLNSPVSFPSHSLSRPNPVHSINESYGHIGNTRVFQRVKIDAVYMYHFTSNPNVFDQNFKLLCSKKHFFKFNIFELTKILISPIRIHRPLIILTKVR